MLDFFKKYKKTKEEEQKIKEEILKLNSQKTLDMGGVGYLTDDWAQLKYKIHLDKVKPKDLNSKEESVALSKIKVEEYKSQVSYYASKAKQDKVSFRSQKGAMESLNNLIDAQEKSLKVFGFSDEAIKLYGKNLRESVISPIDDLTEKQIQQLKLEKEISEARKQEFIDISVNGALSDAWAKKQIAVEKQKIAIQKSKSPNKNNLLNAVESNVKMREYQSQLDLYKGQANKNNKNILDIPGAKEALDNYKHFYDEKLRISGATEKQIQIANKKFEDKWAQGKKQEVVTLKDTLSQQISILDYYYNKSGILTTENYNLQKKLIEKEYKDNVKLYGKIFSLMKKKSEMEKLERKNRKNLSSLKDTTMGIKDAGDDLSKQYQTTGQIIEHSLVGAFDSASNALYGLIAGTKSASEAFKQMSLNIVSDLVRMIIKQEIYNSLLGTKGSKGGGILPVALKAGLSLFGLYDGWKSPSASSIHVGAGGTTAFHMHTGGIVGADSFKDSSIISERMVNSSPRFHVGLLPDEYPAILQKGEGVFTKNQMAALGKKSAPNVQVKIINNTNEKTDSKVDKPKWDGEKWVIGVVLDAMHRNGGFRSNLKSVVAG